MERLDYTNGEAYTRNKYGRRETAETIPAIAEFAEMMRRNKSVKSAVFLAEMHVHYGKKLMRVSDFIHYLKGKSHMEQTCKEKNCYGKTVQEIRGRIALGIFNLVELNGKLVNESHVWKLGEIEKMLGEQTERVYVLPFKYVGQVAPKSSRKAVEDSWRDFVDHQGYEGLVVYADNLVKIKTEYELDAVIVGINKNDGFHKKLGTSVRLAVMKDADTFVEIGDVASGITIPMREKLWEYKKEFALDETNATAYTMPLFVVKIILTDFFERDMPSWQFVDNQRVDKGLTPSITMRHPRLVEVRKDKSCSPADIGINQISILRSKGKY